MWMPARLQKIITEVQARWAYRTTFKDSKNRTAYLPYGRNGWRSMLGESYNPFTDRVNVSFYVNGRLGSFGSMTRKDFSNIVRLSPYEKLFTNKEKTL